MLTHSLLFLASIVVLIYSSTLLVSALTSISIAFRMSQFTVSFLLMAVATSLPETFVGIMAALESTPILSVYNVLGSNLVALTLIVGIGALVSGGIRVQNSVRRRDAFYMTVTSLSPLVLMADGLLSRNDGVLLLLLYVLYLYRLLHQRVEYTKVMKNHTHRSPRRVLKDVAVFGFGIGLLLASADILVRTSTKIAEGLGLPLTLIGLILVAIGTSLPELSFEIEAVLRQRSSMVLGNILGSVVVNSTFVLGITSLISPIPLPLDWSYLFTAAFLVLAVSIFVTFIRSKSRLSLVEGLGLVFLYILFVVVEVAI